jgi:hypothetical protein
MTGQRESRARSLLAVAGWAGAAAVATAVGLVATGAIGSSITGTTTTPLSQQQVARALARSVPTPTRQPTSTPPAAPGGITRALDTPGGTIIARCHTGQATLISWSPAQGYDSEEIHAGPAPAATMTFEAEHTEIRVRVVCPAGVPTAHITTRPDADQDQD